MLNVRSGKLKENEISCELRKFLLELRISYGDLQGFIGSGFPAVEKAHSYTHFPISAVHLRSNG